jgi:hypothetical protein
MEKMVEGREPRRGREQESRRNQRMHKARLLGQRPLAPARMMYSMFKLVKGEQSGTVGRIATERGAFPGALP